MREITEIKDHDRRSDRGRHRARARCCRSCRAALEQRRLDASVVVVWAGVLQGLGKPAVPYRHRPAAPGSQAARRPWRCSRRSSSCSRSSTSSRPASSRSATRLRRLDGSDRLHGTRRSARRTHGRTPQRGRSSASSGRSTPAARSSIVPILNRAPGGAVAMLSSANTNVGLTHFAPWNSPGEPRIYYPTGVRNYARVAASDDYQGPAGVTLLQSKAFKLAQGQEVQGRQERLHPSRQPDVREGRRPGVPGQGQGPRPQGARLRAVGREGDELRGDRLSRSSRRERSPCTSAASSATTA